jgi:hypothetical protein
VNTLGVLDTQKKRNNCPLHNETNIFYTHFIDVQYQAKIYYEGRWFVCFVCHNEISPTTLSLVALLVSLESLQKPSVSMI